MYLLMVMIHVIITQGPAKDVPETGNRRMSTHLTGLIGSCSGHGDDTENDRHREEDPCTTYVPASFNRGKHRSSRKTSDVISTR